MVKTQIHVFENLEALSHAAARRFADLARAAAAAGRSFTCALSGGATPRRLYELLSDPELRIPWERVHLFQVDERTVPPEDAESNYRMIREALLSRVPVAGGHFHRLAGEAEDRNAAALEYAAELGRILQSPPGSLPRLDLVFLGMGADGHTASLFPLSPALGERKLWVCSNYSPRLGKYRLTLTYPVLNAAAEIIFLVSGDDKAETLLQVLEGPRDIYPAQGISPAQGRVSWYVDRPAARLLSKPARSSA